MILSTLEKGVSFSSLFSFFGLSHSSFLVYRTSSLSFLEFSSLCAFVLPMAMLPPPFPIIGFPLLSPLRSLQCILVVASSFLSWPVNNFLFNISVPI